VVSRSVLTLVCAAVCGCLASAGASAAQTRVLKRTFGALTDPQGVGVDQTNGAVYVAEAGSDRVQEFTGEGTFLLMFGGKVNKTAVTMGGTQAEQDVCSAISGDECQAGTPGSAPGSFTKAEFVAVDNDPGSSSFHDVYVADTGDNVVSKFTPEGALVESWGVGGQLNGSSTTSGSFGEIAGIAVGATGTLYVLNTGDEVFKFEPDSAFASEFELKTEFSGVASVGFAVDGAGDLFKATPGGSLIEFGPSGNELVFITNFETESRVFTVEQEGDLFFADPNGTLGHYEFNGGGEIVEPGGGTCKAGCAPTDSVAVGFVGSGIGVASSGGDSYLANASEGDVAQYGPLVTIPDASTDPASEFTPTGTGAQLNGTVNPDGLVVSECEFEYGTTTSYGSLAACEPTPGEGVGHIGKGTEPVEVHAAISGLTPGATYHVRLRAANENGPNLGEDEHFETPPPPAIDGATVTSLTATSATLNATIKPQLTEAHYHLEYDTKPYAPGEAGHGVRVPAHEAEDSSIPAGTSDVFVSAPIGGLSANTIFYWRVVATNESGTTVSVGHTFIYDTSGGGLPDNRAYEMVTPTRKNGALIGDVSFLGLPPSIAADGSRVIAPAIQCFANSGSCDATQGDGIGSPYEFARTSGGWTTTALVPPASQYTQSTTWAYNASTGAALFSMPTPPPLGEGEDDLYVREPGGSFRDIGPNTPPAAGIRGPVGGKTSDLEQVATADFSHFAWDAPEPWPPFEESPGGQRVYEYAGVGNARPLQVGVSGGRESSSLISECDTTLGPPGGFPPGIMSGDGRTVFFTAFACESGTGENTGKKVPADIVYARVDGELADAHTVAISEPSPSECGEGSQAAEVACRSAEPANAGFVGASTDGSKAFFLATQQLTDQASEDDSGDNAAAGNGCGRTSGPNGCNLYEYDFANPEREKLVDVSSGDVSGKGPQVQGVMALSPDGSHVYFIAKGILSTAPNDRGQTAQVGADNLYVFERDATFPAGRVTFIAGLPTSDVQEWAEEPGRPANVTPDGRFLVFVSHGDLTADDTSASGAQQVFRYDAQSGQLNRVSIGNDGFDDNGNRSTPTPCNAANDCSEEARLARAARTGRSDPSMSNDGSRVFFESPVGLAPHALDDVEIGGEPGEPAYAENVYEWEREGVGSCPLGRASGCVFLLSDGRDVSVNFGGVSVCTIASVCLLGADEKGTNVFFATSDQLVPADTNTELDYYDARVCEPQSGNPCIEASPSPSPPCLGEACHGIPPATPGTPAAPSTTFEGQGNVLVSPPKAKTAEQIRVEKLAKALKKCRKDKSKSRRRACEKQARRRYAAKARAKKAQAKKSGTVKRAGNDRRPK